MKVKLSSTKDFREFVKKTVGGCSEFVKSFCKECGLTEMELILLLLDSQIDLDFNVVRKINEKMEDSLFVPSSETKSFILFD